MAFELGPFTVHWYGIMVGLGALAGFWTASRRGLRDGFPLDKVYDLGWWLFAGIILGARLWYVASYWKEEFADASWTHIFNIRNGGLVFYGGFVGASIGILLYCWRTKDPLWRIADMLAPSIALGSAFGRIGCLMTGCCYGHACSYPWAIHFPSDHATRGMPVHPTQIYDAAINLLLYVVLERLHRRKSFDGQVFAGWLILYPICRSITELFRGDYPQRYLAGWLTPAQVLSALILTIGVVLWMKLPRVTGRKKDSPNQAESPAA